ncbi:MAG: NAD(P)-dependent oxidoreductase [Lamprobacter sp.]|uniref:NAD-dependent epimerase/dehydratase family protein n=1 Tax=Lamprobacter sp. TaxID=3100796 RepID=UPI002B25C124|nr:NAD(P)-dependent oxidoreductase [Lamprobacter sp.]MEA3641713.1 NAD(P)-dependent oxidoreductase [Lamprobacter sp.]
MASAQNCGSLELGKGRHRDELSHSLHAEPGQYLTSERNLDCLNGTLRLAQAFQCNGGRRFIGIGTCFEYDVQARVLSTGTSLRPGTLYAAAKASTFQLLSQLLPAAGIGFAWCRLFYLYGEGEDPRRLVPHLHARLSAGEPAELTSGRQIRDFLDVREAGERIAAVALGERQGAINICSGVPITVRQLAEQIADEYGRRDLLHFGARLDNRFDPPCVLGIPDRDFQHGSA